MGVVVTSALLFAASVAGTVVWCSADCCGGVPMPGDWTLSRFWLRGAEQSWLGAAATFVGMWAVMMPAMMLPSLLPVLRPLRNAAAALLGAGYFSVWILVGAAIYPLGALVVSAGLHWPAVGRILPVAAGILVVLGGGYQWTPWKLGQLDCCRGKGDSASPWRDGLRLGVRCVRCCLGFTAILLATGAMNLIAMGVVTVAISAERLLPRADLVARGLGLAAIAWGAGAILKSTF